MILIHGLPESYIRKLTGMTTTEVAVAAATYRSSSRRKGTATQLILDWHRSTHSTNEHEAFLILYALAFSVVKAQRSLGLAVRPADRPVVGRKPTWGHRMSRQTVPQLHPVAAA